MNWVCRRPYPKFTAINCGKPRRPPKITLLEQVLHPLSGIPAQIRYDVAICVHCQADLRVAKEIHHDARRNALDQQQRFARMSKVVESTLRKPGPIQELMETFRHSGSIQRCPDRCREDKSTPTQRRPAICRSWF